MMNRFTPLVFVLCLPQLCFAGPVPTFRANTPEAKFLVDAIDLQDQALAQHKTEADPAFKTQAQELAQRYAAEGSSSPDVVIANLREVAADLNIDSARFENALAQAREILGSDPSPEQVQKAMNAVSQAVRLPSGAALETCKVAGISLVTVGLMTALVGLVEGDAISQPTRNIMGITFLGGVIGGGFILGSCGD
jgi:hypothetical protein